MSDSIVAAEGLRKAYRMYDRPSHRLLELLARRPLHREHLALDDVSFTLPRGQSLGIVGENGAGKSTLLEILAGITTPSAGSFRVAGKVAAILELGAGFHSELTGRQNIVLNAAMLGLDEQEVVEKLPRILAFSELGPFIDRPVKTYSTGMAMRLAFSIATQVDPDVLIIDEALSVGDGYFQKKCVDRLLEIIREGGTVLFCSHAMYYVTSLCQQALWLRDGQVAGFGPALEVVAAYEDFLLRKGQQGADEAPARGEAPARLRRVALWDEAAGQEVASPAVYRHGEPWAVTIEWETRDPRLPFHVGVGVNRSDGIEVCSFTTFRSGLPASVDRHRHALRLRLPQLPMIKGEYTLYVFLVDGEGLHVYDRQVLDRLFRVASEEYVFGIVAPAHEWALEPDAGELPAGAVAAAGARG
ncbi:MAG TPA: ABC transporter ATP-binding protein [Thermoanaerobaculia bacterium]|nr:ABC transporter ATP-binding protein [Thermoanaerobaculia bacterium]